MSDKSLADKAVNIKGKKYVQVKDRIQYLADQDKPYSIDTDYKYYPEKDLWVVKAILTIDGNTYTGLAQEIESSDSKEVNHASALENCETSAVGRACAMAGIGVVDSIASSDEMHKAQNAAKPASEKQVAMLRETAKRITGDEDGEQLDSFIKTVVGYLPDQLSTKAVWQANNKLKAYQEAIQERERKELDKVPDTVVETIPQSEEEMSNLLDKVS